MGTHPRYFTDEFEHAIDSVNRLVIPAKWRSGESEEFYVFPREEGRLAVLTSAEVDRMLHEIHNAPGISAKEKRDQSQILFSGAVQVTCDKQGRITTDTRLLKHAGLKDRVVLVGGGLRFEMWNPKAWARRNAELAGMKTTTLDKFGI